jgi:hypothetical protein
LWHNEKIEEARKTLLTHYNSVQTSQVTRLIGFVAGLFTLLQLTQVSRTSTLSTMFSSFQTNIIIPPLLWDGFRFAILYIGTLIITFFILRAIFRFCIFGFISSAILNMSKGYFDEHIEKIEIDKEKIALIQTMNILAVMSVLDAKRRVYYLFPAKYFLHFDMKEVEGYKTPKYWGTFCILILALVISTLIIVILW